MKPQDVLIYRDIQRSTQKTMKTLETVADKVYDKDLERILASHSLQYSDIHNNALKQLLNADSEPYRGSIFEDALEKTKIQYHTMLNTSTSHIAEMMIGQSNRGIIDMEKTLKHNELAGEQSVGLARRLIEIEERNVRKLKDFL